MLKMIVELDEERLERDGFDIHSCWGQINDIRLDIPGVSEQEKGIYITESAGARSWFMECLEDTGWFLKYVKTWIIDDPTIKDDVIGSYREMGIKCCYD